MFQIKRKQSCVAVQGRGSNQAIGNTQSGTQTIIGEKVIRTGELGSVWPEDLKTRHKLLYLTLLVLITAAHQEFHGYHTGHTESLGC